MKLRVTSNLEMQANTTSWGTPIKHLLTLTLPWDESSRAVWKVGAGVSGNFEDFDKLWRQNGGPSELLGGEAVGSLYQTAVCLSCFVSVTEDGRLCLPLVFCPCLASRTPFCF